MYLCDWLAATNAYSSHTHTPDHPTAALSSKRCHATKIKLIHCICVTDIRKQVAAVKRIAARRRYKDESDKRKEGKATGFSLNFKLLYH